MCLYHCWFEEAYTEDTSRSNTLKIIHSGDVDGDPDDASAGQLSGFGGKGVGKGGPLHPLRLLQKQRKNQSQRPHSSLHA